MARFLATWLLIVAACWTVVGVVLAPMVPGGGWTIAALALLAMVPLPLLLVGLRRHGNPGRAMRLYVFRPFWYLQLLLPFAGAAGALGLLIGLPFGQARAVGRVVLALFAIAAALILWLGYRDARRVVRRDFVASHPDLPEGLAGVRIAQISDVHVGPHTPRRHLARIARYVRGACADLVVMTGDQVDDFPGDVVPFAVGLLPLEAPLGTVAIAGNHDVYAGWEAVRSGLESHGITVLVNEARRLESDGAELWLVGVGDPAGRSRGDDRSVAPDIPRALADVPPGAFVLALAHNPALWPALAERGVQLTLSGHTHWGQLVIGGRWSLASLFLEHSMGAYVEGDSILYIHPGTNHWGIPFRLGTPPEVAVITLARGPLDFAVAPR